MFQHPASTVGLQPRHREPTQTNRDSEGPFGATRVAFGIMGSFSGCPGSFGQALLEPWLCCGSL